MDTKSPKERLLICLRKGQAERVIKLIQQFPGRTHTISLSLFVSLCPSLSLLAFHHFTHIQTHKHTHSCFIADELSVYMSSDIEENYLTHTLLKFTHFFTHTLIHTYTYSKTHTHSWLIADEMSVDCRYVWGADTAVNTHTHSCFIVDELSVNHLTHTLLIHTHSHIHLLTKTHTLTHGLLQMSWV